MRQALPLGEWATCPLLTIVLVSILIACYNAERWVAQAMESALAQIWQQSQVIIGNDGSTEDSKDIAGGTTAP